MGREFNNFNRDALNRATFELDLVSFKELKNDKFVAVVAVLDGKRDVVAVCPSRSVAELVRNACENGTFEAPTSGSERMNPVGRDLSAVLDDNPEN